MGYELRRNNNWFIIGIGDGRTPDCRRDRKLCVVIVIKDVKIGKDTYTIKRLAPVDFLGVKGGCPVNIFAATRPKTQYEQIQEKLGHKTVSAEKEVEAIRVILSRGLIRINSKPVEIDTFLSQEATDESMLALIYLQNAIIDLSFNVKLTQPIHIDDARKIDRLAKRYGKTPIDIIMPNGGYTEMDAFCFNAFVASHGISEANELMKKGIQPMIEV